MQVEAVLSELEAALGHAFCSPDLLVRALTHRSLANERALSEQGTGGPETAAQTGDYERLEFLGDAVLGLVVAEALFGAHPEWKEGELTRVRSQLVNRQHMAEVAMAVGLGNHLRLSRGEDRSGLRNKSTVLSNSMEAVMGALFLDGGLEPVRGFAHRWVMGGAGQLQIGAAGALAGGQGGNAGVPGEERKRPRSQEAVSGGGPSETGGRRAGQTAGPRHGKHQETCGTGCRAARPRSPDGDGGQGERPTRNSRA